MDNAVNDEGPYRVKPTRLPVSTYSANADDARWERVGDLWHAFYHKAVGPGRDYGIMFKDDPNWWSKDSSNWYCRHAHLTCVACGEKGTYVSDKAIASTVQKLKEMLGADVDGTVELDHGVRVYEHDIRQIAALIDALHGATEVEDAFILTAEAVVWSPNSYQIGTLRFDGEQWNFTAHDQESDAPK